MHAKEQEIEKRKTQVREKVQAQLNRVESEHRNLDHLRRVRLFFFTTNSCLSCLCPDKCDGSLRNLLSIPILKFFVYLFLKLPSLSVAYLQSASDHQIISHVFIWIFSISRICFRYPSEKLCLSLFKHFFIFYCFIQLPLISIERQTLCYKYIYQC